MSSGVALVGRPAVSASVSWACETAGRAVRSGLSSARSTSLAARSSAASSDSGLSAASARVSIAWETVGRPDSSLPVPTCRSGTLANASLVNENEPSFSSALGMPNASASLAP